MCIKWLGLVILQVLGYSIAEDLAVMWGTAKGISPITIILLSVMAYLTWVNRAKIMCLIMSIKGKIGI